MEHNGSLTHRYGKQRIPTMRTVLYFEPEPAQAATPSAIERSHLKLVVLHAFRNKK